MNQEILDVQAGFRKGRGTRDRIVNIRWIIAKARELQKNIYFKEALNTLKTWCGSQQFSPVQSLSCVRLLVTPWTAAHQASLSITNSRSLPKLMSFELVIPCNHLILSSTSPPAFKLSQHRGLFKWVSSSHQVAEVLEFQLQHQFFQWTLRTVLL